MFCESVEHFGESALRIVATWNAIQTASDGIEQSEIYVVRHYARLREIMSFDCIDSGIATLRFAC